MTTKNIYARLPDLMKPDQPVVLATVIEATGSTPQVPGSSALIGREGLVAGTVGGGLLEYQVVGESVRLMESGKPRLLIFDLAGHLAEGNDTICGGRMVVLLDPRPELHQETFVRLRESLLAHEAGLLVTLIPAGSEQSGLRRFWLTTGSLSGLAETVSGSVLQVVQKMLLSPRTSGFTKLTYQAVSTGSEGTACIEPVVPPPALVIAGAGHVGKAVARIGKFLGFEVTIWDDRPEYANKIAIPEADFILNGTAGEAFSAMDITEDMYLVIVTRGHAFDADVLRLWIRSRPAYLGMMGSKTKIAQMRQHFLDQGWASQAEWDRVHSPVGLKIGAKTVQEIAVSIAAELVLVRNG